MNNKNDKTHCTCPDCKLDLVNGLALMALSMHDPSLPEPDQECVLCSSKEAQLTEVMKCPVCGFSQLADENSLLH